MRTQLLQAVFLTLILAVFAFCILYTLRAQPISVRKPACELPSTAKIRKKLPASPQLLAFGSVCHVPQCIALYESGLLSEDNRIPAMRHILWKTDKVSRYMAMQLTTWNSTHPNWTYVLWRDTDLERFVAKHFTGALAKFKSVREHIMRVDMIRYMILHHFGGVYADLDYQVYKPLDRFLKFPAVVTRESEAHALLMLGMDAFPPPVLGNLAFMMSEPRHPFFLYSLVQVNARPADDVMGFAGPVALSDLLKMYARDFPLSENPDGVVIVPASRNFYGFEGNSLASTTDTYKAANLGRLRDKCRELKMQRSSVAKELAEYCKDVSNLDPITDRSELMYALHDVNKSRSAYNYGGSSFFENDLVDIRSLLPNVVMADVLI